MAYKQKSAQVVSEGGTGVGSLTAYTPVCGGTTSTSALQSVASLGSSTQVFTSNGAALPSFQAIPSGGGGTTGTLTATTSGTSVNFSGFPSTTKLIIFSMNNVAADDAGGEFGFQIGDSGGIEATSYLGRTSNATSTQNIWATYATLSNTATITTGSTYVSQIELNLYESSSNTWIISHTTSIVDGTKAMYGVGIKVLSGTLTQVELIVATAGDFSAGDVNVLYYE